VQAAELYGCVLDDVLEATARAAAALGVTPWLAVHPPEARDELARRAPAGFRVVPQRGASLSERMESAAADAWAEGHAPVLLRGSDSPLLDEAVLVAALAALERADVVVCPDRDGGYNLVGLRSAAPGLFEHAMSTASVLEDTLARAAGRGLRAERLPPGFDIDTAEDLHHLARARGPGRRLCPRTLAWLDHHAAWPAPTSGGR